LNASEENILGTDEGGKDILAVILYGFRIAVASGFTLTAASTALGIVIGAGLGYYEGKIDLLGQRFMEIWSDFPVTYIILMLSSFMLPSFGILLCIMLLFSWIGQANLVRMEFLKGRKLLYVLSARALGVPDRSSSFGIFCRMPLSVP
jgi:microcin C transport system permease protein